MTQSLKDIIMKAVPQYYEVEFGSWITKWPGQVVLVGNITNNFLDVKYFKTFYGTQPYNYMYLHTGRNICWTAAVTDGIVNDRLKDVLKELGEQLLENVNLIRTGGLTKSMRSTLESLIIADSHAKTGT